MKMLFLLPFLIACQSPSEGGSQPDSFKSSVVVDQSFKSNAAIYSDEIILADLSHKSMKLSSHCGPSPEPGKHYQYELLNDTLILDDQRVQVSYERVTDEGGILNGKWNMLASSDRDMKSGTLEIDRNKIHFISHCAQ